MQTNFAPEQLADPAMAASEKILRTCVHCGFCTATCPTYLLLGDELDSPRGRIYLIKDMLEGGKPASREVVKHVDRCLSCLSCMTTCPSGVHYMHLVDHARTHIEKTYKRPFSDRALRALLALVLPYPNRFRLALLAAKVGAPFRPLVARLPRVGNRLAAMLDLAPAQLPNRNRTDRPGTFPADTSAQEISTLFQTGEDKAPAPRRGRVALLRGCAQSVLRPDFNEAAIRLLNRHGVEVVLPKGEGCCGALTHHMGREDSAHGHAKRTIDAWIAEMDGPGLDAIVVTASGCGTTIKDYGFMFRDDPAYAEKAARVSAIAKDVTEYMAEIGLLPPVEDTDLVVAYHSACSMQHGQAIRTEPKNLLKKAGFTVKDVPEGHICCGSAGTYNILQPEIAARLRDRKVANIERVKPDLIATGNIGCATQIGKGTDIPILHTVELLDWATGGPRPEALAHLPARPAVARAYA
ncbi:heterodisulfide reductase-related iron-sulfur binding cluster [Methylorubrum rhodesianum]|uniref:Glycolate oxidase iron-sulfur subunit n=1 Tax=Methylorubrum rhodesianum TaxID=29427 RepID=A0ABU9ZF21_9HYPH|nr:MULTISPECIES: heterodisulfide reductase-related iron-sulfur binding cluster [Methylorubrum]MBY0139926.1 4Fe-4S dicluster domain-containing protein [Methylorubrum populi]MRI52895.1 4Fe-4S dicluster domain-containing protein [Methylobacterium sp. DB1607]MBB5762874.1 glycolate oxidase iron-sulfur subunit [Methylorubrum rhodesianum]MBI1688833.1 4Fe-4S dicluster domain-containing protein [Methylorubrum sp. DB1722]MBK3404372.1 4Fe-4S dicluster domain-containing protein [Methylorubrum rhodesianum]